MITVQKVKHKKKKPHKVKFPIIIFFKTKQIVIRIIRIKYGKKKPNEKNN
jgi:hypothetical protein